MNENQSSLDYIAELEELLHWVHDELEMMTTQEFANGKDKAIRDKIANLLIFETEA
jgi:hypothetical protein